MVSEELRNFINRAEKGRKYAPNSAYGIKAALGYFEKELNEEEQNSLEKFKANFEAIYASVIRSNQDKLSPGSLEVYKRRISSLLNDYTEYGSDPAKFVVWNPIRRTPSVKRKNIAVLPTEKTEEVNETKQDSYSPASTEGMFRSEIPLRPGVKAFILTPEDLNPNDVEKIKLFIDYLSSLAKKS